MLIYLYQKVSVDKVLTSHQDVKVSKTMLFRAMFDWSKHKCLPQRQKLCFYIMEILIVAKLFWPEAYTAYNFISFCSILLNWDHFPICMITNQCALNSNQSLWTNKYMLLQLWVELLWQEFMPMQCHDRFICQRERKRKRSLSGNVDYMMFILHHEEFVNFFYIVSTFFLLKGTFRGSSSTESQSRVFTNMPIDCWSFTKLIFRLLKFW